MPLRSAPVTLGEGGTPLTAADRLASQLGLSWIGIKDEAVNPTGSFKARGLSAAVTAARDRGARRLAAPSAGNAALALAAYGARAGLPVDLYLPADTPAPFMEAARLHGATVHAVPGTIADCGRVMREDPAHAARFDLSTLREPYRIEGKKTMAYELHEQTGGALADAIVYPTGGGTGLIGMWKAFEEMRALGWPLPGRPPRMIAVQADGCAPIVRAFEQGAERAAAWEGARTCASGLRVPSAIGDFLVLRALRESGGTALAVTDEALLEGARTLAAVEGISAAPEGGASLAALRLALSRGLVRRGERVILFNTGTAFPYLGAFAGAAA